MLLWTIHDPSPYGSPSAERADRIVAIKDGFTWLGFLFPLLWLLWNRLWLGTLLYLVAVALSAAAAAFLPIGDLGSALLGFLASLWIGFEGNDMRRRKLARKRYAQIGSVVARTRLDAERLFFNAWAAPSASPPRPARPGALQTPPSYAPEVLGLFPEPGGGR